MVPAGNVAITESQIRSDARAHGPPLSLSALVLRQVAAELSLAGRGMLLRQRCNRRATQLYRAMPARLFAAINGPQAWANWRTIPRSLSGLIPARPLRVLDLCCGTGDSTAVLAHYCPPGSSILGLDISAEFIEAARRRAFHHAGGQAADVAFHAQSVLETFKDPHGQPLLDGSVDLLSSCGAVGVHFTPEQTSVLAAECSRVLRSGGIAALDSGFEGTSTRRLISLFREQGFTCVRTVRSCWLDRHIQVCLSKN